MKAFAIKNKEGKYLAVSSSNYEHYWSTIDFAHYFRFLGGTHDAKQEAEEFRNTRYPDCEVVEITITEGDLEEQLDNTEQELAFYQDEIKNRGTCGLCEKLENRQINKLKEQLAIREKEFIIYLGDIKQHLSANIVERNGYDVIIMDYQDAFHFIDRIIEKIEQAKEK